MAEKYPGRLQQPQKLIDLQDLDFNCDFDILK